MNEYQTIHGNVPSKSNCYRIVKHGKIASLAKTKALTDYEKNFFIQCAQRGEIITGYFEFHVNVFYPNERADLDNSLKIVLDCLQKVGVIKNDNKCVLIIAKKFKDEKSPRIQYMIKEI